ncbi:MAG TPA: hypothetical protein DHV62_04230, partial [Elusimicrobia bacterium]|nr:hypothetical protein [Elusimicrobiota bacterium]
MGDIIKSFVSRSGVGEKLRSLRFYFDTGSPRTFVKFSVATKIKGIAKLSHPIVFSGLGNGNFRATHMLALQIKLSDLWVPHLCYVVPDEVLDPNYDVLLGHDFMQIYDIQVKPKQKEITIRKESLRMALKVRSISKRIAKLLSRSVLLLLAIGYWLTANSFSAEIEVIPTGNLSLLGGQYLFEKEAASFGGNVYLEVAPSLQFTDELSLIPTYSTTYRGTKNVTELVGGGTLSQQAQDHLISLKLTNQTSEDFKLKINTSYKLELLKETKDESWGSGLFDYYKIAGGVEGEKKFFPEKAGLESLTAGYGYYILKFNNYAS